MARCKCFGAVVHVLGVGVLDESKATSRLAGYAALIERYKIRAMPHWHRSQVMEGNTRQTEVVGGEVVDTYPGAYWPGESAFEQLEFALKYDGTNLALLAVLLPAIGAQEITRFVESKPYGKYARRVWYFYEMLTGERLALSDLKRGNYVDLVERAEYFTIEGGEAIRRQRINNNLLGDVRYCPTVRRSAKIAEFVSRDLAARCRTLLAAYSPELLRRAMSYMYTKETKSSFEIENIKPDASRTERFISLLRAALKEDLCTKSSLIDLQNQIVDPRFKDKDYRTTQNYVGQTASVGQRASGGHGASVDQRMSAENERVHYVCPKPEYVEELMAGVIGAHGRMERGVVHPVVHASVVGYGFVFVHPFEDGNGRIHRLLIHNILTRRGFAPPGVIFPVSAVMLKKSEAYDASLEAFSRPLLSVVDFTLDDEGRMKVHNDPGVWYRYPDMTAQVESLFEFVEQTIEVELFEELALLESYEVTKRAIQGIVEMPDRDIDLFIRLCLQNEFRLSQRKREAHFHVLSEEEIKRMERAVEERFGGKGKVGS